MSEEKKNSDKITGKGANSRLCFLCCENFIGEVRAVIDTEGWSDVTAQPFPIRCGDVPFKWKEIEGILPEGITHISILGGFCLSKMEGEPENINSIGPVKLEECFHLIAPKALVSDLISRGGYLVTSGWLNNWKKNIEQLGFNESSVADFYKDSIRELIFLDTNISPGAYSKFQELASLIGLPATHLSIGLDFTRLFLFRLVLEWRLENEHRDLIAKEKFHAQELGEFLTTMDFIGQLALLKNEQNTIETMKEMFQMLFAPGELNYIQFKDGAMDSGQSVSPEVAGKISLLDGPWAWDEAKKGFYLKINWADETLGILYAGKFSFPEYLEKYLNLSLSLVKVCGLAIKNARTYGQIKNTENALRMSEHNLKMAQSIAHLGHWEWNIEGESMNWSDEIYRIFGYDIGTLSPGLDFFLSVIHPDDRKMVDDQMKASVSKGSHFDLEYRIVMPDGTLRMVHGLGEVINFGLSEKPRMIGSIRDVTGTHPVKVLGVIQDITDRKELEIKLEKEAHTDFLTGSANRRFFLSQANAEFERIRRYGGNLSILMLDLDYFKSVNDKYGHQAGNLVLQKFVKICQDSLRKEDSIGRLGGEEFAILLPETQLEKAFDVAERIRREVESEKVILPNNKYVQFTASIGVSQLLKEDSAIDLAFERADEALYKAKNKGRNRVC